MTAILEQVKAVNALLEAGEPANISVDTYSGFTGYKPQHIIDAMNEVFGIGGWGFEEISNEIAEGDKAMLIISQVRVFLKDIDFQPSGWGQARITKGDIGDAKKGAQTDAIKKALSYFSIGNRAYLGLLKEDVSKSHQNGHQNGVPSRQSNGTANHSKTATASSESELASIPTVSQLKADAASLQIKNGDGSIMTWQDVLAHVFKKAIASGQVTIEALLEQELSPDACKRVQQFLQAVREARQAKVVTSGK